MHGYIHKHIYIISISIYIYLYIYTYAYINNITKYLYLYLYIISIHIYIYISNKYTISMALFFPSPSALLSCQKNGERWPWQRIATGTSGASASATTRRTARWADCRAAWSGPERCRCTRPGGWGMGDRNLWKK